MRARNPLSDAVRDGGSGTRTELVEIRRGNLVLERNVTTATWENAPTDTKGNLSTGKIIRGHALSPVTRFDERARGSVSLIRLNETRVKSFKAPHNGDYVHRRSAASGGFDSRFKRAVETVILFSSLSAASCAVSIEPCRYRFGYESSREKSPKSNGATFRL